VGQLNIRLENERISSSALRGYLESPSTFAIIVRVGGYDKSGCDSSSR
jgi:hypothetical protein